MSVHMSTQEKTASKRCDREIIFNTKHIFFQMSFTAVISVTVNNADFDMMSERHNKTAN